MSAGPRGPTAGPLDLRVVEARLASATPGQWVMLDGWGPLAADGLYRCARIGVLEAGPVLFPSGPYGAHDLIGRKEDFEFIARAAGDLAALLAHCRALRAALQPFAEAAKGVPPNMDDDLNLDRQFAAGDLRRAGAVLAQATDGPT